MTREKMVRIVRKLLTRHRDLEPEQAAERIADAIEDQLVIEAEDEPREINFDELGSDVRHPAGRAPVDPRARKKQQDTALPGSPAVKIIRPDTAEAREILEKAGMRSRINVKDSPPAPPPRTDPDKPAWDIIAMQQELYRSTPEELTIEVEHEGRKHPFKLVRNIVLEPAMGAIRLSYKDDRFMGDDMTSQHLFFTAEAELNIEAAISKILTTARELHRPKERRPIAPVNDAPFTAAIPVKDAHGNVLIKYGMPPSTRATGVSADAPDSVEDNRSFVRKKEGT